MKLLPASLTCLCLHAVCLFSFLGTAAAQGDEIIPACIEGQLFEIPRHPGLSVSEPDGNFISPSELEEFLSEHSPNSELLELADFSYSIHGEGRFGTPPLDLILGRSIPYGVSQLVVRRESKPLLGKPKTSILKISKTGTKEKREIGLTYFGDPVELSCYFGLPAYSKDPETLSCTLFAAPDDENYIRVRFRTGRDQDGHWPQAQYDPERLQEPIDLIQQAVETLKANAEESERCQ